MSQEFLFNLTDEELDRLGNMTRDDLWYEYETNISFGHLHILIFKHGYDMYVPVYMFEFEEDRQKAYIEEMKTEGKAHYFEEENLWCVEVDMNYALDYGMELKIGRAHV